MLLLDEWRESTFLGDGDAYYQSDGEGKDDHQVDDDGARLDSLELQQSFNKLLRTFQLLGKVI